jgi:hypothetical protein
VSSEGSSRRYLSSVGGDVVPLVREEVPPPLAVFALVSCACVPSSLLVAPLTAMAAAASSNMHTGRTIMLERDAKVGFRRPLERVELGTRIMARCATRLV